MLPVDDSDGTSAKQSLVITTECFRVSNCAAKESVADESQKEIDYSVLVTGFSSYCLPHTKQHYRKESMELFKEGTQKCISKRFL